MPGQIHSHMSRHSHMVVARTSGPMRGRPCPNGGAAAASAPGPEDPADSADTGDAADFGAALQEWAALMTSMNSARV